MHPCVEQDRLAGLTIMAVHSSHAQQADTQAISREELHAGKPQKAVLPDNKALKRGGGV